MSNVSLKDILTGVQSTVFKNKHTFTLYTICLVLTNEWLRKGICGQKLLKSTSKI